MPRVAGVDPGTISFDLCVLQDGSPVVERTFASAELDPGELIAALEAHGPYDLIYGPSGYGLPLLRADAIGERELAEMVLVRPGEEGGVRGMRRLLRALVATDLPVIFGPGAIHLPTVPPHRKWNRIDVGTADKVASAALGIAQQAERLGIPYEETAFVMLELGGGFSAALAVDGGQIVDGLGGSAGPIGARACGALDAEAAYLIGGALSKETVFSGGALDPDGALDLGSHEALARLRDDPRADDGWRALEEGAAKAVLALTAAVPAPREVLVSGRLAAAPGVLDGLADRLRDVAPVRAAQAAKSAVRGAAILADGLAGGGYAALVDRMRLREARGGALDHLRMYGADTISLG
jgi:predicted butyrate kinase (DUF1464 family)